MEVDRGPVRDPAAELGAASARSLLLTVLGEFVLPGGRPVWTSTLLELLADLDVAEKAARQAIMRTADSGWIDGEPDRPGDPVVADRRRAPSCCARAPTGSTASRPTERPWDGRWLVLTVASRRTAGRCASGCARGWAGRASARRPRASG